MATIEKNEKAEEKRGSDNEKEVTAKTKRLLIAISVVLLVLGIVGMAVFLLRGGKGGGRGDDDSSSIVILVPIWVGVWIPLWAATRKKRQELDRSSQLLIVGVGILVALLAVAGLVAFLMMG